MPAGTPPASWAAGRIVGRIRSDAFGPLPCLPLPLSSLGKDQTPGRRQRCPRGLPPLLRVPRGGRLPAAPGTGSPPRRWPRADQMPPPALRQQWQCPPCGPHWPLPSVAPAPRGPFRPARSRCPPRHTASARLWDPRLSPPHPRTHHPAPPQSGSGRSQSPYAPNSPSRPLESSSHTEQHSRAHVHTHTHTQSSVIFGTSHKHSAGQIFLKGRDDKQAYLKF